MQVVTTSMSVASFNSNLVRLRLAALKQIGLTQKEGFNSNLVRLRRSGQSHKALYGTSFNSNLVRLRPITTMTLPGLSERFNSNLVRLRPAPQT